MPDTFATFAPAAKGEPKPATFIAAMRHFFGQRSEQTLMDFNAELKALSPADREFFKAGLQANGYNLPA